MWSAITGSARFTDAFTHIVMQSVASNMEFKKAEMSSGAGLLALAVTFCFCIESLNMF